MSTKKYYICPNCEDLVTETDLLDACSNGGMPYCYCEFDNGKIFIDYKRISQKEWEKMKLQKTKK